MSVTVFIVTSVTVPQPLFVRFACSASSRVWILLFHPSCPSPLHFGSSSSFFLPSGHQVNITFCHLFPPTHNILPYHLTSYFPYFLKLFVILTFFSDSSFLIFNILYVFAATLQKSLSGLNSFFLQSAIHYIIYICIGMYMYIYICICMYYVYKYIYI